MVVALVVDPVADLVVDPRVVDLQVVDLVLGLVVELVLVLVPA